MILPLTALALVVVLIVIVFRALKTKPFEPIDLSNPIYSMAQEMANKTDQTKMVIRDKFSGILMVKRADIAYLSDDEEVVGVLPPHRSKKETVICFQK